MLGSTCSMVTDAVADSGICGAVLAVNSGVQDAPSAQVLDVTSSAAWCFEFADVPFYRCKQPQQRFKNVCSRSWDGKTIVSPSSSRFYGVGGQSDLVERPGYVKHDVASDVVIRNGNISRRRSKTIKIEHVLAEQCQLELSLGQ